jgi:hypothetical protein
MVLLLGINLSWHVMFASGVALCAMFLFATVILAIFPLSIRFLLMLLACLIPCLTWCVGLDRRLCFVLMLSVLFAASLLCICYVSVGVLLLCACQCCITFANLPGFHNISKI